MSFGAAKKSARRVKFIEELMKSLTSKRIFGTIGKTKSEQIIATYAHPMLKVELEKILRTMNPSWSDKNLASKVEQSLLWEGDKNTTVNNIQLMGTQHRPDYIVKFDDIRVGVELKRGDNGSAVRDALGQCLVYSTEYDFVCCVIADTSKDEKIKHAYKKGSKEKELLDKLWEDFNIKVAVV